LGPTLHPPGTFSMLFPTPFLFLSDSWTDTHPALSGILFPNPPACLFVRSRLFMYPLFPFASAPPPHLQHYESVSIVKVPTTPPFSPTHTLQPISTRQNAVPSHEKNPLLFVARSALSILLPSVPLHPFPYPSCEAIILFSSDISNCPMFLPTLRFYCFTP